MKLIDFYAEWCGPCRALMSVLSEVLPAYPGIQMEKVEVDENEEFTEGFGIRNLPTLILLDGDVEVARITGALGRSELQEWLDKNIKK